MPVTPRHETRSGAGSTFRIAGRRFVSPQPLPILARFAVSEAARPEIVPASPEVVAADEGPLMGGYGWVGNRRIEVRCQWCDHGYRLGIDRREVIRVSADGRCLEHLPTAADQRSLLPAALVLALALHGTWCLHASAVTRNGSAVVFIGAAGSGKSTLASYLSRNQAAGWQLIADDVLPLVVCGEEARALPYFPQPCIRGSNQYGPPLPELLPIQAIYLLDEGPATGDCHVTLTPLGRLEALAAVIRHTLGVGLFGHRQLSAHLSAATQLASGTFLRCLRYPRRYTLLSRVAAALRDESETK